MSKDFQPYLKQKGITFERSYSHTKKNGVDEYKHQQIFKLFKLYYLIQLAPALFWVEVVTTVVHVINHQLYPNLSNQYSSFHCHPTYDMLHSFGYAFLVLPQSPYGLNLPLNPFNVLS